MLEQSLVKTNFLGRDGFIWWIGQVVDQTQWAGNFGGHPTETTEEQKGFGFRYKVRIMGYHTASPSDLPDEDLPWASVLLPVTAGTSGGAQGTPNLRQGDFVQGIFLDGEDGQQPVIIGVLGYNQYTAVMKNIPDTGFMPFSGYTTEDQVPQYNLPLKEKDTGSSEGQIALFTHRINHLSQHLNKNPKDFNTERSLVKLVGKRKNLLDYLKNKDINRYRTIIKKLKLRK